MGSSCLDASVCAISASLKSKSRYIACASAFNFCPSASEGESAKSLVRTVLRSCRSALACCAGAALARDNRSVASRRHWLRRLSLSTSTPHLPQYFVPTRFSALQAGQASYIGVPHSLQNRFSPGFRVLHFGHWPTTGVALAAVGGRASALGGGRTEAVADGVPGGATTVFRTASTNSAIFWKRRSGFRCNAFSTRMSHEASRPGTASLGSSKAPSGRRPVSNS